MVGELTDRLRDLANLERIRSARIEPLMLQKSLSGDISATSEIMKLPKLRPGRIHVITNLCVIEIGSGTPQVFLGIMSKGEKYYVFSDTVTTAEDSITWSGQIIAAEFDEIFAELQSASDDELITLTAFGYSMRL